jgi:hypothetical protein
MTTPQAAANAILNLVLSAVNWPNIADNTATAPLTNVYIALHTADPGPTGNQTTNEIAYTGYTRVPVARSAAGWSAASGGSSSPLAAINFPAGTGGGGTAAYASIGTALSGAGQVIWSGPISPAIVCGAGVTPSLTTASTVVVS